MYKRFGFGVFITVLVAALVGGCRSQGKTANTDRPKEVSNGAANAPLSGSRSQGKAVGVDTTKDVYNDDEAPEFQIEVVNGVEKKIPWNQVPEAARWLADWEDGGKRFKYRVPVVRVEYSSRDRDGKPVPLKASYDLDMIQYGLNPKYFMSTYYGNSH